MGNLEKAGIAVVVVLLAVIMVVAFVTDPGDSGSTDRKSETAQHQGGNSDPGAETETNLDASRKVDSGGPGRAIIQAPPSEGPGGFGQPLIIPGPGIIPEEFPGRQSSDPLNPLPLGSDPGSIPPASAEVKTVTVQPGDNPWKIAERVFGAALATRMAPLIVSENAIRDPLAIREGTVLKIPEVPVHLEGAKSSPSLSSKASKPKAESGFPPFDPGPTALDELDAISPAKSGSDASGGDRIYVVRHGDALSAIAQRELGSARQMKRIMELNGLSDPDKIREGMRLKLPLVASSRDDDNN